MSENNDPTPDTPETPEPPAPAKRRFRDRFAGTGERLRGTRALVAATLAALIVGGFGGAAIHAAVDGDDHDRGRFFFRGDHPGEMGRDFFRQAPPGFPGPVPPTPTPSESSDS